MSDPTQLAQARRSLELNKLLTIPRNFRRAWVDLTVMDQTIDIFPNAGRHPIRLTDRWTVVVLVPTRGDLVLAFLFEDELVYLTDKPAGQA